MNVGIGTGNNETEPPEVRARELRLHAGVAELDEALAGVDDRPPQSQLQRSHHFGGGPHRIHPPARGLHRHPARGGHRYRRSRPTARATATDRRWECPGRPDRRHRAAAARGAAGGILPLCFGRETESFLTQVHTQTTKHAIVTRSPQDRGIAVYCIAATQVFRSRIAVQHCIVPIHQIGWMIVTNPIDAIAQPRGAESSVGFAHYFLVRLLGHLCSIHPK